MAMYILKQGQKKQPLVGVWIESRGTAKIVHKEEVVFEPGDVVDTTLDFDSWVPRVLSKIVRAPSKPKAAEPAGVTEEPVEATEEPVGDTEEPARDEEHVEEDEEPVEEEEVEEGKEEAADYEELEDGTFSCLHCGKVLRTETGMGKHVNKSH